MLEGLRDKTMRFLAIELQLGLVPYSFAIASHDGIKVSYKVVGYSSEQGIVILMSESIRLEVLEYFLHVVGG